MLLLSLLIEIVALYIIFSKYSLLAQLIAEGSMFFLCLWWVGHSQGVWHTINIVSTGIWAFNALISLIIYIKRE